MARGRKSLTGAEQEAKARSEEEKALARRAAARKKRVNELMDQNPQIVQSLLETAERMVASPKAAGLAVDPPAAPAKTSKNVVDPSSDEAQNRSLERQTYRLDLLTICDMKTRLLIINPLRYTPHALKALMKYGQREVAKAAAGEVLEYNTGMELTATIGPGFFKTVGDLGDHMKDLSLELPGGALRAQTLPLPPDWATDGVYAKVHGTADELVVEHRWLKARVVVRADASKFRWSGSGEDVTIDKNFSDKRAQLVDKSVAQPPLSLYGVFAAAGVDVQLNASQAAAGDERALCDKEGGGKVDTPPAKRRRRIATPSLCRATAAKSEPARPPPLLATVLSKRSPEKQGKQVAAPKAEEGSDDEGQLVGSQRGHEVKAESGGLEEDLAEALCDVAPGSAAISRRGSSPDRGGAAEIPAGVAGVKAEPPEEAGFAPPAPQA